MLQFMTTKPMFVSIALSLSLCVACGGSDGGGGAAGGSAGSGPVGSSGSGNLAGSGSGGSGAAGAPSTSSGNYSSGVAGDKQLSSLSDQEVAGLCKKLGDYFTTGPVGKDLQDFSCRFAGLFAGFAAQSDAELRAACKTTYDACKAAPTKTESTCGKPEASCTATVAEYDACVNDSVKALAALEGALPSCDKLTLAFLNSSDPGMSSDPPASCTILDSKCPSAPG